MAKVSTIKQIGETLCGKNFLGFAPTSNSTKPPHIANGLFRESLGTTNDTSDFHNWMIEKRTVKAGGEEVGMSSQEIIKKYEDILYRGERTNEMKVKQFRALLNELFNPDNTVYGSMEFSSYNISSACLLRKKVSSEGGIGEFIYDILATPLDGVQSACLNLIKKSVGDNDDNFTQLIKPIVSIKAPDNKSNTVKQDGAGQPATEWDKWKISIRRGFDNLAKNLTVLGENNNSLLVQERIVSLACFATFLYLANANSAQFSGQDAPILIDSGIDSESIKRASEQSFTIAKTFVEDYYANAIKKYLLSKDVKDTTESCENYIEEMLFASASEREKIIPNLKDQYNTFHKDLGNIDSLSRALQFILYTFEYKNNSPSDFCRVLGIRCGLVGPKGNRAKIKRYVVNGFLLETLLLSSLSEEDITEGIEMKEAARKMTDSFGIIFGFNDESEYNLLEKHNITKSTPGDLRGDMALNSQRISDILISLGIGHRYADGVTILKWNI